jgi:hypothetical protein
VTGQVSLIIQGVSSLLSVNVAPSSHRKPTVSAHPVTVVVLRQSIRVAQYLWCLWCVSVSGRVITPLFKISNVLCRTRDATVISQVLLAFFGFWVVNKEFK